MDAVRYIKKKKAKLPKCNAKKKRRYEALERDTDEGCRTREGRSKLEQMSPWKRDAGAAETRRKRMRMWKSPPLVPPEMQMEEEADPSAEKREIRKKLRYEDLHSVPLGGMVEEE